MGFYPCLVTRPVASYHPGNTLYTPRNLPRFSPRNASNTRLAPYFYYPPKLLAPHHDIVSFPLPFLTKPFNLAKIRKVSPKLCHIGYKKKTPNSKGPKCSSFDQPSTCVLPPRARSGFTTEFLGYIQRNTGCTHRFPHYTMKIPGGGAPKIFTFIGLC